MKLRSRLLSRRVFNLRSAPTAEPRGLLPAQPPRPAHRAHTSEDAQVGPRRIHGRAPQPAAPPPGVPSRGGSPGHRPSSRPSSAPKRRCPRRLRPPGGQFAPAAAAGGGAGGEGGDGADAWGPGTVPVPPEAAAAVWGGVGAGEAPADGKEKLDPCNSG